MKPDEGRCVLVNFMNRTAKYRRAGIVLFGLVVLLIFAQSALAQGSSNPSKIMDQYRSQRIQWTTNIWPYANTLFGLLAVIEFAWSAAVMLLEKSDLQSWTSALVRKIMWIGCFYALLLNGRTWIPWIIQSFEQIGESSSGVAALSPSGVFSQGLNIAGSLMDSASTSAFFTKPGSSLALVFAALIIVLSYGIITLQFIVAMVESYIIVAAGFIFIGFGGSRWTVPYTERYIGLAVSTGVKIMLLYLLIGAGLNFAVDWQTAATTIAASPSPMMGAFDIMGAAVIFMMLCWQIPKLFSAVLGGAPALTGGDLLSTGTGLVAGAAAVGSLAAGGVALAARGAGAISGVGAAAGAGGSGAGTSAAGVGAAGRGSGGGAGSGFVPPPSSPSSGPSGNGGPKQPNPPSRNGGSGGVSADVAGVGGSTSSGGASPVRNGSGQYHGSNGNGPANSSSIASALSSVGGDQLTGSGFEGERSATGFTPSSSPIPSTSPIRSSLGADVGSSTDHATSIPPPARGPVGAYPSSASFSGGRSEGNRSTSAANERNGSGTGSTPGAVADVRSVGSGSATSQPPGSRRERVGSAARRADHVLSRVSGRLRGVRNQLGGLPSDAAPHTPPPRMPIEHHD
jgi:type IV secretion system protein TrbL